ncbi:MAG: HSP20-like chaperone [Benniella sp.]|nr:MAG: HSP20-like chaperone [Benniella sp.]
MSTTKPLILTPEVYWAQRSNLVYLTIDLQDTVNQEITLKEDNLKFGATSDGKEWGFSFPFFAAVDVEASNKLTKISPRNIFLTLKKAQDGWWDRLYKGPSKLNFVKTDFARWKDDEEEDEEEEAGMGGMGGMGGPGGPALYDSDDEDLPDGDEEDGKEDDVPALEPTSEEP